MALAITAVFVSCDDPKHEHSFDANKWESDGTSHWHVCTTCGEKVDVAEHTLKTTEAKEPTCTESGWDEYVTCSVCGYSTYKEKAATGHSIVEHPAQTATCEKIGWHAYETCSKCDFSTYKEIPALGHDVTSEGKCTRCCKDNFEIASIEDKKYTSLASAIEASGDSDTIKLLRNITLTESLDVTKIVAIDLDGKLITVSEGKSIKVSGEEGVVGLSNISQSQEDFISYEAKISISDDEPIYYCSFDVAMTAAGDADGAILTLNDNVEIRKEYTVNASLTIDMNGKTITPTENASISVGEEAVLIVTNVAENQKDFVSSEAKMSLSGDDAIYYCPFNIAMYAAADNDINVEMITLTDDATVDNEYSINGSLTIDLNEKTLTIVDSNPFISVSSSDASESCEVTIKNGAVLANRTNKDITKGNHQIIFSVDVGGSIILDDVDVTDNTDYGYVFSACGSSEYNKEESYVSRVVIKNGSTITTTGVSAEAIIASENLYSDNSPILIEVESSTISATGTGALAVDIGGDQGSVSLNITDSTIKGDACALGVQGNGTADVRNSTIELTQTAKDRLPINAPIAMVSDTGKTKLTLNKVTSKYIEGAADGKIWLCNSITDMPSVDVISVYGSLDSKVLTNYVKGDKKSSSYLK